MDDRFFMMPNISMSLMQNFTKQIAVVFDYFRYCFPCLAATSSGCVAAEVA
jgi:hypothetical protein